MKIALISDGHLFQSYIETCDSTNDFKSILQIIKQKHSPDVLLGAGDMFDFKKTDTTYLRQYEGEGLMIRVKNILKDFRKM